MSNRNYQEINLPETIEQKLCQCLCLTEKIQGKEYLFNYLTYFTIQPLFYQLKSRHFIFQVKGLVYLRPT